jgi:hypothetical protein
MARGFESKDVEFQQAEAERPRSVSPAMTADERDRAARRRTIELSLARARNELAAAARFAHRRMLERAVVDLERQLASVSAEPASPHDSQA